MMSMEQVDKFLCERIADMAASARVLQRPLARSNPTNDQVWTIKSREAIISSYQERLRYLRVEKQNPGSAWLLNPAEVANFIKNLHTSFDQRAHTDKTGELGREASKINKFMENPAGYVVNPFYIQELPEAAFVEIDFIETYMRPLLMRKYPPGSF